MVGTLSLGILEGMLYLFWVSRGFITTLGGMFGALYVAELMAVGKKRSSLRATLIIAFAYAIIGEISILLLSPISPILVVIVQITSLLLLVQHYYESNWLVIFTVALAIAFVIILGLALLSIVFEPPRPY